MVSTFASSREGLWPEFDIPSVVFRGKAFTMTMGGHPDVLRATVGAAYLGDWSMSEYSLPIEVRSLGTGSRTRPSRF